MFKKNAISFDEMTDLPKGLREALADTYFIQRLSIEQTKSGDDGSEKFLFRLTDGARIEAVVLKHGDRVTFCLSSQVGCPVNCAYCATGHMGFRRNLTVEEVVAQFVLLRAHTKKVNSIVFMGMGEPLLNMKNVIPAISIITSHRGFNLGTRHVTLSTAGEIKGIRRLAGLNTHIRLAVSLGSLKETLRNELIPMNRKYPLAELIPALKEYVDAAKRLITFEWVMIDGVNDNINEAFRLVRLRRKLPFKVNLIAYNPVPSNRQFRPSPAENIERFRGVLEEAGIEVIERFRQGQSINAGCGQLAITSR